MTAAGVLRSLVRKVPGAARALGGLRDAVGRAAGMRAFSQTFRYFEAMNAGTARRMPMTWNDRIPCLDDQTARTAFDHHYTYHPAWAARVLAKTRPALHIDLSSILHFSTLVSAFLPVQFYDYRPADLKLSNLTTGQADLVSLPFADGSVESLSCMHVVEHIGLGRYGDPLDPEGDLKAMKELRRVVAPGGSLLFAVPVGRPRVCFNAHRVYSYASIVEAYAGFKLRSFALIPDAGGLIEGADATLTDSQKYGCGCFWFERPR